MVSERLKYTMPQTRVYEVKVEGFICTSGEGDSEREDYVPENWD